MAYTQIKTNRIRWNLSNCDWIRNWMNPRAPLISEQSGNNNLTSVYTECRPQELSHMIDKLAHVKHEDFDNCNEFYRWFIEEYAKLNKCFEMMCSFYDLDYDESNNEYRKCKHYYSNNLSRPSKRKEGKERSLVQRQSTAINWSSKRSTKL